jgi:hypothetical protein
VLVQASRLPEEKLKPLFDESQWKVLKKHLDQARGIEPFLKANGFHPDSDPAAGVRPVGIMPGPMAPMGMGRMGGPMRRALAAPAKVPAR